MTNVFLFQALDTSISSNKLWSSVVVGREFRYFFVQAFITLAKICNI